MRIKSVIVTAIVVCAAVAAERTEAGLSYYGGDGQGVTVMDLQRRGGSPFDADSEVDFKKATAILQRTVNRYSRTKREIQGNRVVRKPLPLNDRLAPIGEEGNWYSEVGLGNPAQAIEFDIDMTSADSWVESTTSIHGTRFDSENSQTYFTERKQVFRDCVASNDNLTIAELSFGSDFAHCTPHRASVRTLNPSGGMIGLAFDSLTQTEMTPFLQSATSTGVIADKMFTLEFRGDNDLKLAIGGLSRKIDEPLWATVKTVGFWQLLFKSLLMNGNTVLSNIHGVLDVTSPLVLAPPEDVRLFYNFIPGAQPLANGFWSYPCYEQPSLHVEHAGWLFPLTDLSIGKVKDGSGYCVGFLAEADLGGLWVMGEPLLSKIITVYDVEEKRVGFRSP
ncbi:aspartic peptidase domain-containing protein [Dipodascopsis tothii]|uniref:aspartic peptidase domain-containing protein n=1 Tax=Dipodascopsis tothii TaxID=44089 RepID=UPI0034CD0DCC